VLRQSLHNKADRNIFSVLNADERDQLASALSKVRIKAFEELGITDVELSVKYVPREQAEISEAR
jgi:hypothetical protein